MESDDFDCDYIPSGSHQSKQSSDNFAYQSDPSQLETHDICVDSQPASMTKLPDSDPLSLLYETDSDCEEIEGGVFSNSIDVMNSNGEICQVNGFSLEIPLADMGVIPPSSTCLCS
jgi:hypothetical protein